MRRRVRQIAIFFAMLMSPGALAQSGDRGTLLRLPRDAPHSSGEDIAGPRQIEPWRMTAWPFPVDGFSLDVGNATQSDAKHEELPWYSPSPSRVDQVLLTEGTQAPTRGELKLRSLAFEQDTTWGVPADVAPIPAVDVSEETSDVALTPANLHFDGHGQLQSYAMEEPACPPLGIDRWVPRFGYWGVDTDGAPTKVGEYQSLQASPFWDWDGLYTNRRQTIDLHATGLDQDGTQVGLFFYNYPIRVRVDYQRFLRRLDNDPLSGFTPYNQQPPNPLPPAPRNFRVMNEDVNVGQDYAIRVQELDTSFSGTLTNNLRWRLNVWSLRKSGERQVAAMAHCYSPPNATDVNGNPATGISCHVLTQKQRIDWLTTEIQPVLEARFGQASVEYSHTTRTFSQDDQLTVRPYDNFGFSGNLPYAVVPESQTNIDRLRIGLDLPDCREIYALLLYGITNNEFRDTDRRFNSYDLRYTDRSMRGVSWTGYVKSFVQDGERPPYLLPGENPATIRAPIDYDLFSAGMRGRWRPFEGEPTWQSSVVFTTGYEYRELDRGNAVFTEQAMSVDESQTISNIVYTRAALRLSPNLDTYVRYRLGFVADPLFGVPVRNTATNSNLPTQQHLVEVGGSWSPSDFFLLSASLGVNASWHSSDIADFQEDDYPVTFTAWYAPTYRWTISGGLAFYSNWIDQDITLGSKTNPLTQPWAYEGRSDVVNLGTTYAWSQRLTLSGALSLVHGTNQFQAPSNYADLTPLSDVLVDIARWSAGIDYRLPAGMDCYLRYQCFDYEDESKAYNSGTVNYLLAGINWVF